MRYSRPIVLSIAGFDPCGGAGVLADVKTFEQNRCLGMAINTAITTQVEDVFYKVEWVSVAEIISNIKVLTQKYQIDFVKIGIIENLDALLAIVKFLKDFNPKTTIVWDTVLSASTGFQFMDVLQQPKLAEALSLIELITPNVNEIKLLSRIEEAKKGAKKLSQYCSVLLKGGHSKENVGVDFLFTKNTVVKFLPSDTEGSQIVNNSGFDSTQPSNKNIKYPKHGSGCILSSAIISNLALGNDLENSCRKAKYYIETILSSNPNLLAYHVA